MLTMAEKHFDAKNFMDNWIIVIDLDISLCTLCYLFICNICCRNLDKGPINGLKVLGNIYALDK